MALELVLRCVCVICLEASFRLQQGSKMGQNCTFCNDADPVILIFCINAFL